MDIYHAMIDEVLETGTRKENRTGVDTISTFNFNYELVWDRGLWGRGNTPHQSYLALQGDPSQGNQPPEGSHLLPLLTTKDVSWKNIVVEMLWFLSGQTDISILRQHGCKIWEPWADKDGKVPSAYGHFWRQFPVLGVPDSLENHYWADSNDQIAWALNTLRTNPMSRRIVVSAWAPGNAQTSALPPCHFSFLFNVQNVPVSKFVDNPEMAAATGMEVSKLTDGFEQRLCLGLSQRSCDLALGVPYNIASYGLLLLIMSHLTGIKPGIFAHTLNDLHIYTAKPNGDKAAWDHIPGLKEQRARAPRKLPYLTIDPSIKELSDIEALMAPDVTTDEILAKFKLSGYEPHDKINFKVAV